MVVYASERRRKPFAKAQVCARVVGAIDRHDLERPVVKRPGVEKFAAAREVFVEARKRVLVDAYNLGRARAGQYVRERKLRGRAVSVGAHVARHRDFFAAAGCEKFGKCPFEFRKKFLHLRHLFFVQIRATKPRRLTPPAALPMPFGVEPVDYGKDFHAALYGRVVGEFELRSVLQHHVFAEHFPQLAAL